MDIKPGRIIILFDDLIKHLIYSLNFSCKKIYDSAEDGSRYFHVVFNENDSTGIWFLLAGTIDQKSNSAHSCWANHDRVIHRSE